MNTKDGSYSGDNSMHLIYFTALISVSPERLTHLSPDHHLTPIQLQELFLVSEDYRREEI